jgi:hypothetical protein
MHVAMATLFALLCWRVRRWLGVIMTIFALVIMIGSVHLAWHYAIDGYVGASGILLIWCLVGRLVGYKEGAAIETNLPLEISRS